MVSPLTPKGGIRVDFLVNNYAKLMKLLDFINDIGQICRKFDGFDMDGLKHDRFATRLATKK
jgi:hypothetical protein